MAKDGVSRRGFFRAGLIGGTALGLGGFGAAALAQLWPNLSGGFGADIEITDMTAAQILEEVRANKAPFAFPSGRMYIVAWEPSLPGARQEYGEGEPHIIMDDNNGLFALFQKCVHLGCRVPWCQTSQWFECPCHGSKYNRWGEWMSGPAPRGLDRFPATINEAGNLVVSTGTVLTGPSRTARVLQQEPEGPHCVDV
jgi:cytochrome b6-f complex iron-sulfur subunit